MKLLAWVLAACTVSGVSRNVSAQERIDYLKEIKPLLHEKCGACHGALKQNARLRLDTALLAKKGGRHGAAVVQGHPEKSLLIERISAREGEERMPPEGPPLTPAQIEKIRTWITQGAPAPSDEQPETDPREHWAFVTPKRAPIPTVKDTNWSKNPVDAFLAAGHEKQGLKPRPHADPSLLLRRVYLDLIGLPPTTQELKAFLEDKSPDAYEKVVDRLLIDPRHGERWGRHWMDVWRYSDWYGRRMVPDVWNSAPQIWRWRDWIVRSVNQDKGYDRMLQEMLAADEIYPEDDDATVATGFLIRNWYALNPNDWMRSNVEHVGKAFLGLTFNCAHCHDHKYDPISHEDYFRFRAYFETIGIRQDAVPGEPDPGPFQEYDYSTLRKVVRTGAVRIFDRNPTAPTWFYTGGDERNRVKEKGVIPPGIPSIFGSSPEVQQVKLPPGASYPRLKPALRASLLKEQHKAIQQAEKELAAARIIDHATLPIAPVSLEKAKLQYQEAVMTAAKTGAPVALSGSQSLILEARTGRRLLYNTLPGLKGFGDGATLRFEVLLIKDAHFNFQLVKDVLKGLTAGYVAFDKGRITSYQPGSFTEFEVGKYDFAAGQNRFAVSLAFETKLNRCRLSVRSVQDGKLVVDSVPVALNDWNPLGDPTKAISFDARAGSVAAVDDVVLVSATKETLARFDFETPRYPAGKDIVGIDGWSTSSFGLAPATSIAGMTTPSPAVREALENLRKAQRAAEAAELPVKAAEARIAAAKAMIESIEARVAADEAKYLKKDEANLPKLTLLAAEKERTAALKSAEAAVLSSDLALATVEIKPASDPMRVKQIEAVSKQLAAARLQLDKAKSALTTPPKAYSPLGPTYPTTSTGRRKALAEWITRKDNPLTARVAVNHIWLRHFHSPLVTTVYDFGRNGARPSHPELLDWLAVEFMESGWSMKKLHRLIVTSQAYRMASSQGTDTANVKIDPENRYLWRMNVGRMESEVVRDSLLHVAGLLDFTMGGQELENADALKTRRRSLYYSCHPETDGKSELGKLFDAPDAGECYRRTRTVVPQQALALTNSDMVHDLSGKLSTALWTKLSAEEQKVPTRFVETAFQTILSRQPRAAEAEACTEFLRMQAESNAKQPDAAARARESLTRVLLNHNDFITVR